MHTTPGRTNWLGVRYANDVGNGPARFIDVKGNQVTEETYASARRLKGGVQTVCPNGKYGLWDLDGKVLVPLLYDDVGHLGEGLVAVKVVGKWGYVRVGGVPLDPVACADSPSDGIVAGEVDGNWCYVDLKKALALPAVYQAAGTFANGLAPVRPEQKSPYGYIDARGDVVLPFVYSKASDFSEGLAPVQTETTADYIDMTGKMVLNWPLVSLLFDFGDFCGGLARVDLGGFRRGPGGYIDKEGTQYWED